MKAIARKIKENGWIADVTEYFDYKGRAGEFYKKYPIVSNSDKEWLEKNNMDGKDVEGEITLNPNGLGKYDVFYLKDTPPIHSDPAGEINPAENAYNLIVGPYQVLNKKHALDMFKVGVAWGKSGDVIIDFKIPPTPQTGKEEEFWKEGAFKNAIEKNLLAEMLVKVLDKIDKAPDDTRYLSVTKPARELLEKLKSGQQTGRTYTEVIRGFARFLNNFYMGSENQITEETISQYLYQNPKP